MKKFHEIVAKYRHGEDKYTAIDKYIKCACVQIELDTYLKMKKIKELTKQ